MTLIQRAMLLHIATMTESEKRASIASLVGRGLIFERTSLQDRDAIRKNAQDLSKEQDIRKFRDAGENEWAELRKLETTLNDYWKKPPAFQPKSQNRDTNLLEFQTNEAKLMYRFPGYSPADMQKLQNLNAARFAAMNAATPEDHSRALAMYASILEKHRLASANSPQSGPPTSRGLSGTQKALLIAGGVGLTGGLAYYLLKRHRDRIRQKQASIAAPFLRAGRFALDQVGRGLSATGGGLMRAGKRTLGHAGEYAKNMTGWGKDYPRAGTSFFTPQARSMRPAQYETALSARLAPEEVSRIAAMRTGTRSVTTPLPNIPATNVPLSQRGRIGELERSVASTPEGAAWLQSVRRAKPGFASYVVPGYAHLRSGVNWLARQPGIWQASLPFRAAHHAAVTPFTSPLYRSMAARAEAAGRPSLGKYIRTAEGVNKAIKTTLSVGLAAAPAYGAYWLARKSPGHAYREATGGMPAPTHGNYDSVAKDLDAHPLDIGGELLVDRTPLGSTVREGMGEAAVPAARAAVRSGLTRIDAIRENPQTAPLAYVSNLLGKTTPLGLATEPLVRRFASQPGPTPTEAVRGVVSRRAGELIDSAPEWYDSPISKRILRPTLYGLAQDLTVGAPDQIADLIGDRVDRSQVLQPGASETVDAVAKLPGTRHVVDPTTIRRDLESAADVARPPLPLGPPGQPPHSFYRDRVDQLVRNVPELHKAYESTAAAVREAKAKQERLQQDIQSQIDRFR